jgi:trimeric autotransporter adhesin
MMKKLIAVVLLVVCLPALANAWFFNTQVKTAGGSMTSRNKVNQALADGSLFKSYTTHAPLSVSVAASTGYRISNVTVNGTVINNPASPYTTTVQGPNSQSVFASFAQAILSVTASASSGGTVSPTSVANILAGVKLAAPVVFTYTPSSGYRLASLSGATGATVSSALPAPTNTVVTVTYPVGYTFTAPVALVGTFDSANPIAVAGPAQTAVYGAQVTLTGSYSGGSVPPASYTWTQTSGPQVALTTFGSSATFTAPSVEATLTFKLTLDTGSSATTSVTVVRSIATAAYNQCQFCHAANNVGPAQLFNNWSASRHEAKGVMCYACHVGTNSGGHPGALISRTVNETTFTYVNSGASFCLNGSCHTPGITHKTVGMACARCHNSGEIHNPNATFAGSADACFTCHGGANTLHYFANSSIGANNCTLCHNNSGHNPAPSASVPRVHFNGYTSYVNPGYAAAYVTPVTLCSDCHKGGDPLSAADLAILQFRTEWAASRHGDTKGAAWLNSKSHNWKASGQAGVKVSQAGAPTDCQRCHTATGYVQFTNTSSIAPIASSAARYSEPLTCNACHNPDFTTRGVSARTGYYNYTSQATGRLLVAARYPDSQTSNICLGCHVGREAGDTIKAMAAATAHGNYSSAFWQNVSFLNSHYLTAGGQVFGVTGYEYPGFNYANTVDHSLVGTGATGPCVTCHLPGKSHTLAPSAASYSQCNSCHNGAMDATFVANKTSDYQAGLKALAAALTQKGFTPNLVNGTLTYPYFTTRNWGNQASGPGNMGAAFNYNMLVHDLGAYAHNPTYAKRLVRDSIDYLVNGSVDRSRDLTATIEALLTNATDRADAKNFVLNAANGSAACAVCHSQTPDPLTGANILATYNLSLHSTVAGGPSCASCHAPSAQVAHPPNMTMLKNPTAIADKCFGCHGIPNGAVPHRWPSLGKCAECHNGHDPKQVKIGFPHYGTYSSAQYVAKNFQCESCHYQQGTPPQFQIFPANFQWATSGHADPQSPAFVGPAPYTEASLEAYDFKFLGTPLPVIAQDTVAKDCVRCHTSTGYVSYVTPTDPARDTTAFQNISPWGTPGDRTREMVACPACHTPTPFDSGFSRRFVGWHDDANSPGIGSNAFVVQGWYNYSSAATSKIKRTKIFTNAGNMVDSNLCITCHSGKATGDLIKQSTDCSNYPSIVCRVGNNVPANGMTGAFWDNVDFVDPHGGAANFMFSGPADSNRAGYEFENRPAFVDTFHSTIQLDLSQGPCVGCHMTSPEQHSFKVISTASNGSITGVRSSRCADCHNDGDFSNTFVMSAATLDRRRVAYRTALTIITNQLAGKGIYYNKEKAPYFFTTADPAQQSMATRTVNWNFSTTFRGANLMGAAFNLRLLDSTSGWVHNGTYAKRLLYDTIDYLYDGNATNNSTAIAIQNSGLDAATRSTVTSYLVPRK